MPLTRTCKVSGKEFIITDEEIGLLDKISPVISGEKFSLPLPIICPKERRRRRLQFKNYLTLFKSTDSITNTSLVSIYPPDSQYIIYSQPYWWSDAWNPLDYGQEYTSNTSIFDQIHALWLKVPVVALDNAYLQLENSEFVNGNGRSKDCYLVSNGSSNERCLYSWYIFNSSNILDANYISNCENCSHSQHLWKCYGVHFSWNTSESRDSWYSFSCEGCQNILGGVGLKNQKLHILNIPCTKSDFDSTLEKLKKDPQFRKDFEIKVLKLLEEFKVENSICTGSVNSSGDFCYDSKNAYECYNIGDCEDVMYITDSFNTKDSIDINMWGENTRLSYNCIATGQDANNMYCCTGSAMNSTYNFYSNNCIGCSYVFGCSGLRNKSYCIFNKQYAEEEYTKTLKIIIKQMQAEGTWGEFLDQRYAFYAYNESHAMEQMPLSREEAIAKGLRWSDRTPPKLEGTTKIIPGEKLPDTIEAIPDDILNWAIECTYTGKFFHIQPLELELLRKFSLPVPKIHPIERIQKRLTWDTRTFSFDF